MLTRALYLYVYNMDKHRRSLQQQQQAAVGCSTTITLYTVGENIIANTKIQNNYSAI